MLIYANRKRADELTAIADDRTRRQAARDKARAELDAMRQWDHIPGVVEQVQKCFLRESDLADALSRNESDCKWESRRAEAAMHRAAVEDGALYVARRYRSTIAKATDIPALRSALTAERATVNHELLRTMTGTSGPQDMTGIAQAIHRLALYYGARYVLACDEALKALDAMRLPSDSTLEWAEYENALAQYPELAEVRDVP